MGLQIVVALSGTFQVSYSFRNSENKAFLNQNYYLLSLELASIIKLLNYYPGYKLLMILLKRFLKFISWKRKSSYQEVQAL